MQVRRNLLKLWTRLITIIRAYVSDAGLTITHPTRWIMSRSRNQQKRQHGFAERSLVEAAEQFQPKPVPANKASSPIRNSLIMSMMIAPLAPIQNALAAKIATATG